MSPGQNPNTLLRVLIVLSTLLVVVVLQTAGSMQLEGLGRQVVSSKDCQEGGRDGELEGRGDQGA
jgi:hypothetical protein